MFMCLFRGHSLWGEKTHKQSPPKKIPGQSREAFVYVFLSATKMTGRPGHWSEPGEYNILFLGSILVISSQDSSALGYREFTHEGAMTISPFAAGEGTSAPQWPNVKKMLSSPRSVPVTSSSSPSRCQFFSLHVFSLPINVPYLHGCAYRITQHGWAHWQTRRD